MNKISISLKKKQFDELIYLNRMLFKYMKLHLATTLIINAIANMFAYLNDPEILHPIQQIGCGELFYTFERRSKSRC